MKRTPDVMIIEIGKLAIERERRRRALVDISRRWRQTDLHNPAIAALGRADRRLNSALDRALKISDQQDQDQ